LCEQVKDTSNGKKTAGKRSAISGKHEFAGRKERNKDITGKAKNYVFRSAEFYIHNSGHNLKQ